jgi:hypothetical protein
VHAAQLLNEDWTRRLRQRKETEKKVNLEMKSRGAQFRQQAEAAQDLQLGIDEDYAHHSIEYEYQVERYKTSNDLGMNSTSTSPSKTRKGATSRSPSSKTCMGIEPIAIVKYACSGAAKIIIKSKPFS